MLREPRRVIPAVVAIAIAVAFAAVTLLVGDSLARTYGEKAAGTVGDSAVVLTPKIPTDTTTTAPMQVAPNVVPAIKQVPGVTGVRAVAQSFAMQTVKGRQDYVLLQSVPQLTDKTTLVDGRLPSASGEVAVTPLIADQRDGKVGSTITLAPAGEPVPLKVVGVIAPGSDQVASASAPYVFVLDSDLFSWSGEGAGYTEVMVFGTGNQAALRDTITALPVVKEANVEVRTGADERASRSKQMEESIQLLSRVLLGFAGIAGLVGALVIANTFAILVAQRTRSLALLRCVGATRGQVFRTMLLETLLVGVVGSAIGLAIAIGLSFLAVLGSRFLGPENTLNGVAIQPWSLLGPALVGIVVTVFAGFMPAVRSTRVAPLAAMRPQLAAPTAHRAGIVTLVLGGIFAAGGFAALAYGAMKPDLLIGIAGGAVSVVGVLLLGSLIVPAVAKVVGALPAAIGGVPAKLAVENSRRNPTRAAATASALLIGVTLITMFVVGQASGMASIDRSINKLVPTDMMISGQTSVTEAQLTSLRKVEGVQAVARIDQVYAKVAGKEGMVAGVGNDATQVSRFPAALAGLSDSVVLLPTDFKRSDGSIVKDGDELQLVGEKATLSLKASVNGDHLGMPVITQADAAKLGPVQSQAWVRIADGANVAETRERIGAAIGDSGLRIDVPADVREQFQQMLGIVTAVITGLLGVAVLIALVGITNTLGLSVIERTQESGLLRAMGLTKAQLRSMLGIEAVTLAGVAVLLGLVLGTVYGIAGTYAALKGSLTVVIAVPWLPIVAIIVVAVVAAWVASVVPSIRAARVSPAAALATE